MATIRDVAAKANVSVATVSRIMNDLPGYSDATKRKVLRAMKDLEYTRNAVASSLAGSKTKSIGVMLPSVSSRFASALLEGIEESARDRRHSVIVCNTDSNGRRTREYLQVLAERRVDGIVFVSEWLTDEYEEQVEKMGIPFVLVSTFTASFPLPYVRIDDRRAAYDATSYLIKHGHRKIGMISGTKEDPIAGIPRVEGYGEALRDNGISYDEDFIVYGDFHYESGRIASDRLLTEHPELTAVFAASDEMALGVLSTAYARGLRVPEQLSVIGYDDAGDARMAIPPLTSVHQPLAEMGKMAVELLFENSHHSVIMPHHIVERKSVKNLEEA